MNIKNQILDAIDDINLITSECEYNTICEMYNSYDKASLILEYYEGDNVDAFNVFDDTDNFYQESSVSDKMKASGKKYNTFMKIITFIPRLIKALFETISEKLKKTKPSKELQKAPKEVKEKLTTVFDKKKDKKKVLELNASFHDVIYAAARSRFLAQVLRSYKEYIEKTRKSIFYEQSYLESILREHRAIFEAIRERDSEKAVDAIAKHLEASQDRAEAVWNLK